MRRPLAGKRIVVTRAQRQSGGLQERLEAEGAAVLLLPTIETVPPVSFAPLDAALKAAAGYQWLVLTSSNAVRAMAERLEHLAIPVATLSHLECAVVGPATARAARTLGLNVTLMPEEYVGEALAAALAGRVRGQQVLVVRGAAARDFVPQTLGAAGAMVTAVDAYQTIVPPDAGARAQRIFVASAPPDAVVFTSGSTVAHLVHVLKDSGHALPHVTACVSIGPVTSAALRSAGLRVAAEASDATLEGLVAACVQLLAPPASL